MGEIEETKSRGKIRIMWLHWRKIKRLNIKDWTCTLGLGSEKMIYVARNLEEWKRLVWQMQSADAILMDGFVDCSLELKFVSTLMD